MPIADPVISGDQVRHDRIRNLVSTVSVIVGIKMQIVISKVSGSRFRVPGSTVIVC